MWKVKQGLQTVAAPAWCFGPVGRQNFIAGSCVGGKPPTWRWPEGKQKKKRPKSLFSLQECVLNDSASFRSAPPPPKEPVPSQ